MRARASDSMERSQELYRRMRAGRWLLPSCFAILAALSAASIALAFISGLARLEPDWIFNIGVDILGIAVCAVLYYGCMNSSDSREETTYLFVALLTTNSFALFLDECAWMVQGVPELRVWNLVVNALYYANGVVLLYQFWRYVRATLGLDGAASHWGTVTLQVALIPATLLCYANLFAPVYFSVDAMGVYRRERLYPLSHLYSLLCVIILTVGLFKSNVPRRQKSAAVSFVTIPVVNSFITLNTFGISTQFVSTLISIVLMYSVLFSDRSKSLAATQTELRTATQIQAAMLPNTFPPFPERTEFDLYAGMDPAKEVGGDFYDFFLIDNDHLCMVMADVSGKGVPAALFMMASKIILANHAKMGKSPAQALTEANAAICANNREEMFVTVWMGVLEISTGRLTASNAGHEYPAWMQPDGAFELLMDEHGIAVGWMEDAVYKDYELQLRPGAKLFLYTDGVPEATDTAKQLFGTERMLAALNAQSDASPEQLLKNVRRAVDGFIQGAEQFDDLTMLCMEYRG